MTEHPEPLLKTKLFIPALRREIVPRPRLVSQLQAGLQRTLTLVSAPAGFGKTTALAEWLAQLQMPLAWVSLDASDNDLARFLAYFVAALQNALPGAGEAALAAFRSPQPPPVESVLAMLVNEIVAGAGSCTLVLDDYHVIRARAVHQAVTYLLDHVPAQMHLVIATRTDPPLPLARLRGRVQLAELRAADLRFTADEAAAFLNQMMGLHLSGEDVAALEARTEGWIVGLQLAALSMKDREDIPGFIAAFTGSHHYILDYLTDEVLRRQPESVRAFLLRTSILDRLCGPLCAALSDAGPTPGEGGPAQAMLEYLERNNLFIVPLDDERRWYRYHHLFADLLRHQLGRWRAGELPELHRRASLWHERHGLILEAVGHALQAGDWQRAADLVEWCGLPLLERGEMMTVLGWLTALPEELVRARPRLCIYLAWILVLTGQLDAVEARLQDAERNLPSQPAAAEGREMLGQVAAIRAYAASHGSDADRVVALAREALQCLAEDDLTTRSVVSYTLGVASILAGDLAAACQALAEAGRIGRAAGNIHLAVPAICGLGDQQMVLGRLHQAAETFQVALQMATGRDGKPLPLAARACSGLSELHYEWGDLEAAMHYGEEGVALGELWGHAEAWVRTPPALARALQARGDMEGAYRALQQADRILQQSNPSPWAIARVDACRVRLWLSPVGGDVAAAARWAAERMGALQAGAELPYMREREHLALARVLIAQGRYGDAVELLARLRAAASAGGRVARVIEILALEAVARRARGELPEAISALEQALALGEPEGYVRTFLDEGAPVAALLGELAGDRRSPRAAYARRLLAALGVQVGDRAQAPRVVEPASAPSPRPTPWVEPLTERELEVLRWMAAGLSNAEIAGRLVIAVSTVKRHVNRIFAKLGVTTRTQALVKAKELGLL